MQLTEMFPNEESAVRWFEAICWPTGERCCGHCSSVNTYQVKNAKPMPYKCRDCGSYFSVRPSSMMESSRLPLHKWAFAAQLFVTNLKGVLSTKLHRDLNFPQKTTWFILHRRRDASSESGLEQFMGLIKVNKTYMGGKRKSMPKSKRKQLTGRGAVGKTAVVGVRTGQRARGQCPRRPVNRCAVLARIHP